MERLDGAAPPPDLDLELAHPLAASLFEALKESPEAAFLTPAAWQRARVSAFVLSEHLLSDKISAVMYTALQQDWKALLIDAGELRRLGIEVRRAVATDPDDEAAVAELDAYRAARSG